MLSGGARVTERPTGTVTFLFTDLERSTRLWEEQPEPMQGALARHDALLAEAVDAHDGVVIKGTGDGVHAVFATADRAVMAAIAAQRALAAESAAADQHIDLAQQMARESLAEARRSVWNLRAPALERGDLSDALRGLASRPIRPETTAIFEQSGDPWPLPPPVESALLRVGQEALVNVAKHAGATHVRLMLEYTPDAVRLSISDDGVGFDELPADVAAPGPWGGCGLLGMRERLVALGGTLELTSDGGAQVVAVVPRESIQQPGVRSQKVHIHSES